MAQEFQRQDRQALQVKFKPGSNEKDGARRGSANYQKAKGASAGFRGTGRVAMNASPKMTMRKQGAPGRPKLIFGQPARGLVPGYVKNKVGG